MVKAQYISSLDLTQKELLALLWTIGGVRGRMVAATGPRADEFLARHATGENTQVFLRVAFVSDSDYSSFCQAIDAEGISRDDE